MDRDYYFTYWIRNHSKEEFKSISDKVLNKVHFPKILKMCVSKDELAISYFFMVYVIITMHIFGLDTKQISFLLDMTITTDTSKCFKPEEVLKNHADAIPIIEKYVRKDLQKYNNT